MFQTLSDNIWQQCGGSGVGTQDLLPGARLVTPEQL